MQSAGTEKLETSLKDILGTFIYTLGKHVEMLQLMN